MTFVSHTYHGISKVVLHVSEKPHGVYVSLHSPAAIPADKPIATAWGIGATFELDTGSGNDPVEIDPQKFARIVAILEGTADGNKTS